MKLKNLRTYLSTFIDFLKNDILSRQNLSLLIVLKPSLGRFHKRLGPIGLADLRQLTKQNACLNIINSLVPVNEYIHWHGGRFQFAP